MNKINIKICRMALLALLAVGLGACNFLDVVPDEMERSEDAFADRNAALNYVYSCYGYLPKSGDGPGSLDLMTGDEVVTPFEQGSELFYRFPQGNYSSSSPVISYWNTLFAGLRQCYMFLEGIDSVPNLPEADKQDYIGQVKFLIAYYHFLLIRCYGPTIIIDRVENVNSEEFKARTPLDECVEFVCRMFDEAAETLPAVRSDIARYGLATSVAAKGFKAKLLMYAASPLFNGNAQFYSDFKNKDGKQLMPTVYDPKKWELCRDAMLEAIQLAERNGYALYDNDQFELEQNQYPTGVQRTLRYNITEPGNKEILMADCRDEGWYGLQNKTIPFTGDNQAAWNGVSPTWAMLNRFYTKNGLPYDEDPAYKNSNKLEIVTIDASREEQGATGYQTLRFNLDREPRFYAWVAFQGGYYEIQNDSYNGGYSQAGVNYNWSNGRMICDFVLHGNCSRLNTAAGTPRSSDYAPTCYLNKKGVRPSFAVYAGYGNAHYHDENPWPMLRLADLYLGYAEACVETGDLTNAKVYLNRVRERAGIPDVETSWAGVASLDQAKLRQIVRQERMIELYLENNNFWDMRRWLLAGEYFNTAPVGLNTLAESITDMARLTNVQTERKFQTPMNYLLPIPIADLNNNLNLVNNPGY